jgi:hypothetical protein
VRHVSLLLAVAMDPSAASASWPFRPPLPPRNSDAAIGIIWFRLPPCGVCRRQHVSYCLAASYTLSHSAGAIESIYAKRAFPRQWTRQAFIYAQMWRRVWSTWVSRWVRYRRMNAASWSRRHDLFGLRYCRMQSSGEEGLRACATLWRPI